MTYLQGGIFTCLFFLWVSSLFALYQTEFYSSEAGLQQALNATAVLFGDKTALTKISGRCVSDGEYECSLVPGLFCSPSLNSSPSLPLSRAGARAAVQRCTRCRASAAVADIGRTNHGGTGCES